MKKKTFIILLVLVAIGVAVYGYMKLGWFGGMKPTTTTPPAPGATGKGRPTNEQACINQGGNWSNGSCHFN